MLRDRIELNSVCPVPLLEVHALRVRYVHGHHLKMFVFCRGVLRAYVRQLSNLTKNVIAGTQQICASSRPEIRASELDVALLSTFH